MKGQSSIESAKMDPRSKLPSAKRIVWGAGGFVILSAAGIFLATRILESSDQNLITSFPLSQYALLVLLIAGDFLLGGLRYRIFFNGSTIPRVSLWRCMFANWANMLLGVVTPFQTGGGPAQIYILWREGVEVSQALLVSLLTFASTLIFFLAASSVAVFVLAAGNFDPALLAAIQVAFVVIACITVVVLGLLVFPAKCISIAGRIGKYLSARFPALESKNARLLEKVESEVSVFRSSLRGIVRIHSTLLPIMFVLTAMLFFNKYLMGYVIAKALEPTVPFDTFMGLQVLQHLIIYYAPTPGASGLASISATWLFRDLLSPNQLITYFVIWRSFTTLLGALLGIPVVVNAMSSPGRRRGTSSNHISELV